MVYANVAVGIPQMYYLLLEYGARAPGPCKVNFAEPLWAKFAESSFYEVG
jgi:hypothetical protein